MATSQDFADLIARIEAATNTLESTTVLLEDGAQQSVADAQAAAQQAEAAVTAAQQVVSDAEDAQEAVIEEAQQAAQQVVSDAQAALQAAAQEAQQAVLDAQQAQQAAEAAASDADASSYECELSEQAAQQAYINAQNLVDQLEAAVILEEAPVDGQVYGRRDGEWVLADTGGGGVGTVTSVNSVQPDGSGNVQLEFTAEDVGALPDSYAPEWDEVTGKPTFAAVATSGSYSDLTETPTYAEVATTGSYDDLSDTPDLAPVATSGNYYDLTGMPVLHRVALTGVYNDLQDKPSLATVATSGSYNDLSQRPALATVATSGAYGDLSGRPVIPTNTSDLNNDSGFLTEAPPYPVDDSTVYDGSSFVSEWVSENPHKTYPVEYIAYYTNIGQYVSGQSVFYGTTADASKITAGKYHFTTNTFSQGPLDGKEGYIEVSDSETAEKYITAFVNPQAGVTEGEIYLYNNSDKEFIPAGGSGGDNGGGGTTGGYAFDETGFYIDGQIANRWPESNPHKGISMDRCSVFNNYGQYVTGPEVFTVSNELRKVPEGWYYSNGEWPEDGSNLAGKVVTLRVCTRWNRKHAIAYVPSNIATELKIFMLRGGSTNDWIEVANNTVIA